MVPRDSKSTAKIYTHLDATNDDDDPMNSYVESAVASGDETVHAARHEILEDPEVAVVD